MQFPIAQKSGAATISSGTVIAYLLNRCTSNLMQFPITQKRMVLMKHRFLLFLIIAASVLVFTACHKAGAVKLSDPAKGYTVTLPENMEFDFSLAKSYTKCISPDMEIFISRETNPYEDILFYLNNYLDRYITLPEYREKNNISLNCHTIEEIDKKKVKILSVTRTPYEGSEIKLNTYSYIYILDSKIPDDFFRIMIKSTEFNMDTIYDIIKSFKEIPVVGELVNQIDTTPVLPDWNDETRKFYNELCNRDDIMWGIFIPEAVSPEGLDSSISDLEKNLDYKFDLCMQYSHIPHEPPPSKGLYEAYEDGKITQMTIQISTLWNNDLGTSVNPNFEVIDGVRDKEIREFAIMVKEFSHPVMLRINNEMNTDWTSYSGVQTLSDPEIFKLVWNRIYDIFKKEGANNAIWVFNPQYGDFPPANFNNYMSYFPGVDKVQILGLTAYNVGDYYSEQIGGHDWKSFSMLYDGMEKAYLEYFSEFPWIIGEFASASHGGIKENWITNMFNKIGDYKNIKGAIWLNWEAYDGRKGSFGTVARCYRLDETDKTLEAFKKGIHGVQQKEELPEH